MKKIILLVLGIILSLSLVACGEKDDKAQENQNNNSNATNSQVEKEPNVDVKPIVSPEEEFFEEKEIK